MSIITRINKAEKRIVDLYNKLKNLPSGGGGVQTISGDFVDNTDPLNPILNDPRPYKVYTALLTQSGTDAPVATVLENTLGVDIEWSRLSEGYYKATPSEPIFEENKTFHFVNSNNQGYQFEVASQFEEDEWRITVIDAGITVDSALKYLPIEIRVYN